MREFHWHFHNVEYEFCLLFRLFLPFEFFNFPPQIMCFKKEFKWIVFLRSNSHQEKHTRITRAIIALRKTFQRPVSQKRSPVSRRVNSGEQEEATRQITCTAHITRWNFDFHYLITRNLDGESRFAARKGPRSFEGPGSDASLLMITRLHNYILCK